MSMTKIQRTYALEDLAKRFKSRKGRQMLLFVAYGIANQHHEDNLHETVVVHTDRIADDDNHTILDIPGWSPEMIDDVVYSLKYLRVPTRLKTTKLDECGCCGHYHPTDFSGDCRDDGNRFVTPSDSDDINSELEDE